MATKRRKHHRRKRSVSAPKRRTKRRRRMGSPIHASSVGKPRRRKRRIGAPKHRRRRRRIGAEGGGRKQTVGQAVTELLMLSLGGAVGDIGASLGGNMMEQQPMNLPPFLIEGAKVAVGTGLFVAGGAGIGTGAFGTFVKGVGLGSVVSGIRGGVRMSGILPPMGMHGAPAPKDMYVILPDTIGEGNNQLYPHNRKKLPGSMGIEKSVIGAQKSVIGMANSRLYGEEFKVMGF
jgi:hypothetical protein